MNLNLSYITETTARVTFASLPAVRPVEDIPDGWTEVADKLVQDTGNLNTIGV